MRREDINKIALQEKWKFVTDPECRGEEEGWPFKGLPAGIEVFVPHTWNVDPVTEDYRGVGWYEYKFKIQELNTGKRIWLHFEAVYRDVKVWINGHEAGRHYNSGYTSFRIDATQYLIEGNNILIAAVDNRNSDTALPISNSFDWADDGGIIREVNMIVTGEAAIDYIQLTATPDLPARNNLNTSGTITGIITMQKSLTTTVNQIELELMVKQNGTIIWEGTQTSSYPCSTILLSNIYLSDIEVWHFDHPNLYEFTIRVSSNRVIHDEISVLLGFREFRAEGSQFRLNGEPVRLVGVEWMPGSLPMKGMAELDDDREQILRQLKHANCILTRFHWQQDEKLLEWCDRNGILVQEELPLWQKPSEPGQEIMPVAKQQIFEMITRHYNHPSVIAWGVGNELDGQSDQTKQFVEELKSYTQGLDKTRMVNYVSNTVHMKPSNDATGVGDAIMWNDYVGTWHGDHDMNEVIQNLITAYPEKPIVVAEFGLCEPAFTGGDSKRMEILRDKTEIYRKYSNIAGYIFFSLNDYRTQMGEDGEGRYRQRVHGVTDIYGVEKPSFQLLRETASPLDMKISRHELSGNLICHLTCRNDLPSYSVSGYYITLETRGGTWEVYYDIPTMSPGDSCEIEISRRGLSSSTKLVINRPTGFSVLDQQINGKIKSL